MFCDFFSVSFDFNFNLTNKVNKAVINAIKTSEIAFAESRFITELNLISSKIVFPTDITTLKIDRTAFDGCTNLKEIECSDFLQGKINKSIQMHRHRSGLPCKGTSKRFRCR